MANKERISATICPLVVLKTKKQAEKEKRSFSAMLEILIEKGLKVK